MVSSDSTLLPLRERALDTRLVDAAHIQETIEESTDEAKASSALYTLASDSVAGLGGEEIVVLLVTLRHELQGTGAAIEIDNRIGTAEIGHAHPKDHTAARLAGINGGRDSL